MLMPSIFGENLIDDFFNDFTRPTVRYSNTSNIMKTDVKETADGYIVDMDLPGYKKEDVKAELKDGYITVTAQTSKENDEKDGNGKYIRRERYYGNCSRSFYVGEDITQEDIKAKFEDGILQITIPKKEEKPQVEENKFITIEG